MSSSQSTITENTPLLSPDASPLSPTTNKPPKPRKNVTFNSQVSTNEASTASGATTALEAQAPAPGANAADNPSVISTLNNKLRRRNSQTSAVPVAAGPAQKIGPQRTSKGAEKLKILPNTEEDEEEPADVDDVRGRDVYVQYTRLKDPTSRRDAARLGKEDRKRLPRVTAYCTAGSYRMEELMRFLKGSKSRDRGAAPRLFDECIYTPWDYGPKPTSSSGNVAGNGEGESQQRRYSDSVAEIQNEENRAIIEQNTNDEGQSFYSGRVPMYSSDGHDMMETQPSQVDFDIEVHTPEVFLFLYGTVVIWGMTLRQEHAFLKEISRFEIEKLAKDDIQTEDFNFYYTREYQARIYNDFISLMDKKSYMTKLAISHALSQSVKTSLFEDLVDNTIETTKDIPAQIATTGKVNLTRREINMQIGELFILRINIHLQGSVLDAPELMWAEPQLDPIYQAVRSYMEMDQRVALLTERLNVIADLLAVLKDQLTHTHGEYLEWIGKFNSSHQIKSQLILS
jgi:uncharacterized Rmd1/YagE family protein